ncbi:MAG: TetR/AcrR family transcriptional regulator C-terminal domain-containing protein [Lachnospiraceae bacterium]|nr:TetR/AcrR family transcriptional regulator C-terminal domain-containing protein [Lachnospiraceae bacterium]
MIRTKSIITDAFWQLLEEKPYNKITVKDIVDCCQVNRNTFYYHFHDIPDLLEYAIKQDVNIIIQNNCKPGAATDCLAQIVEYTSKRQNAILHIYRSIQRELFQKELERLSLYVVTEYIDTVTAEAPLPPEDKQLLIRFHKCLVVGITYDWLDNGMSYDPVASFNQISSIFADSGKQFFF